MRMEALIAATTVLTGHARTNTELVWIHGMNKKNVAKHTENEKLKMPRMMIMLMITTKTINIFKSLFDAYHKLHLKEFAPQKILPPKIKEVEQGEQK